MAGGGRTPTRAACPSPAASPPPARTLAQGFPCRGGSATEPPRRRTASVSATAWSALAARAQPPGVRLPDGRPRSPGERLRNPDLARPLERIGEAGRAGFYEGETAAQMARYARAHGGLFDERDFAA